jgi:hypothetical protein
MALPKPDKQMVHLSSGPYSGARDWGCFLVLLPGSIFALGALQVEGIWPRFFLPLWLALFLFICLGFSTRYRLDLRRREVQGQWSILGLGWFRRIAGFEQLLDWRITSREHPSSLYLHWLDGEGRGQILEVGLFDSQQSIDTEYEKFSQATGISFLPLRERVERQRFWPVDTSATGCILGFLGCLSPVAATVVMALIEVAKPNFHWPDLSGLVYASFAFFLVCPLLDSQREYDAHSGELVRWFRIGGRRLPWVLRTPVRDLVVDEQGQLKLAFGSEQALLADFRDPEIAHVARALLRKKRGLDVD